MKRLLPLLFLVPSIALLIHANRGVECGLVGVRVHVEAGGFEFPADVQLVVVSDTSMDLVTDGWANFLTMESGPVTLRLEGIGLLQEGGDSDLVSVGKPQEFELKRGDDPPTWVITVTPDECRAALVAIRSAR